MILADGSNLGGAGGSSTPSFKDLSGFLLSAMKGIRAQRIAHFALDPFALSSPATVSADSECDPSAAAGGSGKANGSGWKGTGASAKPAAAGAEKQTAGEGASKAKEENPPGQDCMSKVQYPFSELDKENWKTLKEEGQPIPGRPEAFEWRGRVLLQPRTDAAGRLVVEEAGTGEVIFRAAPIVGNAETGVRQGEGKERLHLSSSVARGASGDAAILVED